MRSARFTKANFPKEETAKFRHLVFVAQDIDQLKKLSDGLQDAVDGINNTITTIVTAGIVESVSDDGLGVVEVDVTDPANPVVSFRGINTDGIYAQGDGKALTPVSVTNKVRSAVEMYNFENFK